LIDSLAALDEASAERLFGWTVSRSLVAATGFMALVERRRGVPNAARLRRYVAMWRAGAASELEVLFQVLMRQHRITGWRPNAPVRSGGLTVAVADVFFEAAMLAVEIDGWVAHSSKEAFQKDRTRGNALVQAGCRVLHFTYDDITRHPDYVVSQVKAALAANSER
jgi:very-short-patch-repair endonuclease